MLVETGMLRTWLEINLFGIEFQQFLQNAYFIESQYWDKN